MKENDLIDHIRRKYWVINNRTRHHESYRRKNIINQFDFETFKDFCMKNGFEPGLHVHRLDRNGNYCPENIIFITKEEHLKLSGIERRRLTDEQVKEIKYLHNKGESTSKISMKYPVSQVSIWKLLNGRSYLN